MSKTILIVESDSDLSAQLRSALEGKGFSVDETTDGKGSIELIRTNRPDLVVLAVELSAGQNGYIICGKLKKDDDLKTVPVIIIGNADGFAAHRKLKTRADEYVAKPVETSELIERIGGLIGLPEGASSDEVVDESLSLAELVEDDDEPTSAGAPAMDEELNVPEEGTVAGDPDLDALDAAFDGMGTGDEPLTTEPKGEEEELALDSLAESDEEPVVAPPEEDEESSALDSLGADDDADSALSALGEEPAEEKTQLAPPGPKAAPAKPAPAPARPAPAAAARPGSSTSGGDPAELRELRAKVKELEGTLEEANQRVQDAQAKVEELEGTVSSQRTELETAKAGGGSGKTDKEFFALREANSKKDKEILRLKSELNEKEKEIVEVKDREMSLEQQVAEHSGEIAKRDAQIRTLQQKADQLGAERKRFDKDLLSAKEEARSSTAKLQTLQAEFDQLSESNNSAVGELEELRGKVGDLESRLSEAEEYKRDMEQAKRELETARSEAEDSRNQLEQLQVELDSARNQLQAQTASLEEEANSMRKRVAELEESSGKHEERLTKLYSRIKNDEKMREKTKKALSIALQLLEEQPASLDDEDEAAA